jgi:glycerol-3-phosphate acyltransferase PlsX
MGGDDAPARVVEGALLAARELGLAIELVGPVAELEPRLAREPDRARLPLTLVDAPERVGMADRPRDALRKGATSIRIAVDRVRAGDVSGLFSAGHTGATIVAAVAGLGLLDDPLAQLRGHLLLGSGRVHAAVLRLKTSRSGCEAAGSKA